MGNGESLQDLHFDKITSVSYHPKYERVLFAQRTGRVRGGYTKLTPAYVGYLFYDPVKELITLLFKLREPFC
jgi:hypothetical protein